MTKQIKRITDVAPQRANANRHTQRGMTALERSIQQDGHIGAITVAADGETFDGSARVEVDAALFGDVEPIVVRSNGDRPIIHIREDIPTASDPRAVRLGIAANRVPALNLDFDPAILTAIAAQDIDLSALFTEAEWAGVAMPREQGAVDTAELWKGMPEFEQDDIGAWKSIHVHFANEADYLAFARLVEQALTAQTKSVWYPYKDKTRHLDYRAEDES